ncbi:LIM homeobox transcription factor 1-alpha [Pygocentrus nattereri]|uniref:LIM homeobox transcription factor 1-alpha n=1 Tax=Pygocentrus nattereri TaxID=42514 RepID=UPI001891D985|nr:LIM homeobox transcription factor 1-alpha [Pygocentrus nattereri]
MLCARVSARALNIMGEGSLAPLPVCVDPSLQAVCVCAGCARPIRERFLLRVHCGVWHERCARCCECGELLEKSCFSRDNKLYCRTDYQRLFLVRCRACAEVISPAELVMRAGSAVFHLRCFCCSVCSCRLQKGDRCVLVGDRLLCTRDYQHSLSSPATSDSGRSEDEDDDDEESSLKAAGERNAVGDGELKRPKRPRTILTTQQRRAFKASFEVSSKPCRKVRETLAAETGLSVRVVQVWFQNQRAKMKKLARRQQQQQQQCQSPQEQRDTQTLPTAPSCGLPVELKSMDLYVSVAHQQQQAVSLESHSFKLDPFRQGLTPPQMPGDHMNPYGCEAFYNDVDDSPLCHLGDCMSSEETSLLTPIDRLYSMHDSYFAS